MPVDFAPAWLDVADVLAWLRLNQLTVTDTESAEAARVCAATEAYVTRCRPELFAPATEAPGNGGEPGTPAAGSPLAPASAAFAEAYHGAVMYAARELRRRNSPAGIETFADGGASFVSKWDSDIERALRTGAWSRPGVG